MKYSRLTSCTLNLQRRIIIPIHEFLAILLTSLVGSARSAIDHAWGYMHDSIHVYTTNLDTFWSMWNTSCSSWIGRRRLCSHDYNYRKSYTYIMIPCQLALFLSSWATVRYPIWLSCLSMTHWKKIPSKFREALLMVSELSRISKAYTTVVSKSLHVYWIPFIIQIAGRSLSERLQLNLIVSPTTTVAFLGSCRNLVAAVESIYIIYI